MFFCALIILPQTAEAQYFGRNKVQYEDFNFKILQTENLDVYFYPSEATAAKDAAAMAERWYARLAEVFNHRIKDRQPLILYANHADFQQTNVIGGLISEGTGGVTEGRRNRIVLPLTGSYADNNHVIGHELVHAFQYDLARQPGGSLRGMAAAPLWFIEGLAEYLSIGREDPLTAMWLRDAVLHDDVPTIEDVSSDFRYFPYRYGHALWAFITGRTSDQVIPELYWQTMKQGLDEAFKKVLADSTESLSKKWIASVRETYLPQIQQRTKPENAGERILATDGGINLAPSISPNGEQVAFLSRRDLFTVDLYLADASSGEVINKLVSSNSDAHFDALRFIDSAGSWSPEGRQLAIVVFSNGDNALAIVNVPSGDFEKTIKLKEVEAISNVAWSPDGRSLAFSGSLGGISDLYVYNMETKQLRRLTNDRHADLQPAWSPDGQTIAFATDRGPQTDFERLTFGKMQIALIDVGSGRLQLLSMSEGIKHINPQFSPDGRDIFFIANPYGFSDVFRYALGTREFFQITNVATGVSGITELSPAMSVAQRSGRMMFSIFEKTDYNIYARTPANTRGTKFILGAGEIATDSKLPPVDLAKNGMVKSYLDSPLIGLPTGRSFEVTDYNAALSLQGVSQGGIGIGVNRFGAALGGGVSFLFGDMLGNHFLGVGVQAYGSLKDIGGEVVYENRTNRWNWGAGISHVPYRTGQTLVSAEPVEIDGQSVLAERFEIIRQRVFIDEAALMTAYPLSTNRRFEFSGGFKRISYDFESESVVVIGDQIISQRTQDLEAPASLNLWEGTAAYAGDYSFFGFTSPVSGRRFRFEAEPTFGSLQFTTFFADYRTYFFWRPFTLAFRGMHVGRYFQDAENKRLTPLFLGYQTLVRGYDVNSFEPSDCTQTGNPNDCPEFDRLVGSRLGIINAEFRIPLFGTSAFGLINFPYLPMELSLFVDAGVAWTQNDNPTLEFQRDSSERVPVVSAGGAARINFLGALVMQFYLAHPFQRPNKDWVFGFLFAPGW